MMSIKRNFCKVLLLSALIWSSGKTTWAAEASAAAGFTTQVKVDYVLAASASAKVTVDYTLTNTSPTTFVESYQLKVPEEGVSGVVLQPKKQEIEKEIKNEGGWQVFDLKFTNEVVGQGKAREFGLEYSDTSLVTVRGKNVVVRIPAVGAGTTYQKYQAQVTVPTSFGELTRATPEPNKTTKKAGQLIYTFDLQGNEEIVLQYGDEQTSQFSWEKTLENRSNNSAYQQINLPVNDERKKIFYAFLTPTPVETKVVEGEWQLFYLLKPWEELPVKAAGFVTVTGVDEKYHLEDEVPADLRDNWQSFFVEAVPMEVMTQAEATPAMQVNLDKWWWLPLPGRLTVDVYNQGGAEVTGLRLLATSLTDNIEAVPAESEVKLMPWQKTSVKVRLKNQKWWPLYQESDLKLVLMDGNGKFLGKIEHAGLSLAYPTLAVIGGVLAVAITTGSVLVARKK